MLVAATAGLPSGLIIIPLAVRARYTRSDSGEAEKCL